MTFDISFTKIIINIILTICLVLLIIRRGKLGKNINYFILGIFFTLFSSILGRVLIQVELFNSNHFVFNIGILLVTFFFYFIYFYRKTTRLKLKRIQFCIIILFLILYLLFLIFDKEFMETFPIYFYFIETILLTISILIFLFQTFKTELVLTISHYFPFWASLGLIIIYCGLMPILILGTKPHLGMNMNLFFSIMFFINFIGYGIIIKGIFSSKTLN